MRFEKIIWLFVLGAAFTLRASGQAHENQKVPVLVTWDYYAQPKTLILHILNNSGKDIDAFNITLHSRKPDGTWDEGYSQTSSDMLSGFVNIQMIGDAERRMQENVFSAGTTRDMTLNGINSGADVNAVADVVFYTDGTFDEQNKEGFKRIVVERQRELLAIKKANEIIRGALADSANDHPTATAIEELAKAAVAATTHKPDGPYDPVQGQEMSLQREIANVGNVQEPGRAQQGTTERERLTQYVEEQEKRVELMTPHCHLEVTLK